MERHFYLSRSHNCLQGIGAALPVEDGAVVLYATRTSTDQVSGFGSTAKRGIGNKLMGGRMAQNFERARGVLAAASTAKDVDNLAQDFEHAREVLADEATAKDMDNLKV